MNIYLDTEFILCKNQLELISIGLVKENEACYYAISNEFKPENANEWVIENVISQLDSNIERKSLVQIKDEIEEFIGYQMAHFWAFMGTYDWFLILQLYEGLPHLPYNFSTFCRELRQEMENAQFPESQMPTNPRPHHALWDAKWNRELHRRILNF